MNVETLVEDNGTAKFNGYLKNAQVDWKGQGIFVSVGLVNLKQFSEQENFWGHRYIFKSFQEEYGIAFCEDIGIIAGYEFSRVIAVDVALTNGEGRRLKNMDNRYKYGAGITLKPTDGLILRLYGDIYNTSKYLGTGETDDQYSVAAFAGYRCNRFPLGAEYNRAFNFKFASGIDVNGYSGYTTINIAPKMNLYGRFDLLDAVGKDAGTINTGHAIIAGFEYSPIKQIRISPNYQTWNANGGSRENFLAFERGMQIINKQKEHMKKILILCTGNSCRSQMAHGFLQSLDPALEVFSGGTQPAARVNAKAVEVMREVCIDIASHVPTHVDTYLDREWDYVITVCGGANESCPAFTGKVGRRLHMGFDDPSHAEGSPEFIDSEFRRVRDEIREAFARLYRSEISKREVPECSCDCNC